MQRQRRDTRPADAPRTERPGGNKCPNCSTVHSGECTKPRLDIKDRKCHDCGRTGHISRNCPNKESGVKAIEDGSIASLVSGALDGAFAVTDGDFRPATRTARPRPRGYNIGDVMTPVLNRFKELEDTGDDHAPVPLKSNAYAWACKPGMDYRRDTNPCQHLGVDYRRDTSPVSPEVDYRRDTTICQHLGVDYRRDTSPVSRCCR